MQQSESHRVTDITNVMTPDLTRLILNHPFAFLNPMFASCHGPMNKPRAKDNVHSKSGVHPVHIKRNKSYGRISAGSACLESTLWFRVEWFVYIVLIIAPQNSQAQLEDCQIERVQKQDGSLRQKLDWDPWKALQERHCDTWLKPMQQSESHRVTDITNVMTPDLTRLILNHPFAFLNPMFASCHGPMNKPRAKDNVHSKSGVHPVHIKRNKSYGRISAGSACWESTLWFRVEWFVDIVLIIAPQNSQAQLEDCQIERVQKQDGSLRQKLDWDPWKALQERHCDTWLKPMQQSESHRVTDITNVMTPDLTRLILNHPFAFLNPMFASCHGPMNKPRAKDNVHSKSGVHPVHIKRNKSYGRISAGSACLESTLWFRVEWFVNIVLIIAPQNSQAQLEDCQIERVQKQDGSLRQKLDWDPWKAL